MTATRISNTSLPSIPLAGAGRERGGTV